MLNILKQIKNTQKQNFNLPSIQNAEWNMRERVAGKICLRTFALTFPLGPLRIVLGEE